MDRGPAARSDGRATLGVYTPLACLSLAISAILEVIGTGAPLALHAHGLSLAAVGLFQIVYLPAGLSFLWAPLLDRVGFAALPRRLGWILPAMLGAATALALSAAFGMTSLHMMLGLAFFASLCASVADLASQALLIETVAAERRAWLSAFMLIASSAGSAIGVAFATSVPGWSWPRAFTAVALGSVFMTMPMTTYPEPRHLPSIRRDRPGGSVRRALPRAVMLSLYCVASILLTTAPKFALLDIGLGIASVGLLGGPATALVSALALVTSACIAKRVPLVLQIAFATIGIVGSSMFLIGAVVLKAPVLAIGATLLVIAFDAGLNVPYMRLLYNWSEGATAARDYAFLAGVVFLISFPARIFGPAVAAVAGWPLFLSSATILYAVAGVVLVKKISGEI